MNHLRDTHQIKRTGMSPRAIWIAVSSVFLAALTSTPLFLAPANAASVSGASTTATVGVSVSRNYGYTSVTVPVPTSLEVIPSAIKGGMTLETTTLTTLHLSGTPTAPATYVFTIVGADETATDTATLSVVVSCPDLRDVDSATADICLPNFTPRVLGSQGAAPNDAVTAVTPRVGDPHIAYNTQADGCAGCHRTHGDSRETFVIQNTVSHSVECLACHDGTGATTNVHAEYSDTATSSAVNDPTTRSYYKHDALAVATGHVAAAVDDEGGSLAVNEFQGVSNRHSDCVDCHNPHATALNPISGQQVNETGTVSGWSISGALQSVSVANMQAGFASAFVSHATTGYTGFSNGETITVAANLEYQLCMKCHSSFTQLTQADPLNPTMRSHDWLDKASETDPDAAANKSFHPVSRPGTNQTDTMTASLTGTSAFKLWKFGTTDTVRCTSCHANGAVMAGAGQQLPPHASANRGLLIAPYRDRNLLPETATVDLGRFALCFTCHTDVPFRNQTSSGTSFRYHFVHIAEVNGDGTNSGSIDDPGAGRGHALCSECHFRLHSTKNAVGAQDITGTRLVNFSPNVEAVNGVLQWTPRSGSTAGTCTLKCHGATHRGTAY